MLIRPDLLSAGSTSRAGGTFQELFHASDSPLAGPCPRRLADAVKDVLLDWDPDGEDGPEEVEREPLPPLKPSQFRAALRGEVESALDRVAEILNEAPDLDSMTASAGDVRLCFEWLVHRALERAEQLRLDEAVAQLSTAGGPQGGWVEKYRRLKAAEGQLPGRPGESGADQ